MGGGEGSYICSKCGGEEPKCKICDSVAHVAPACPFIYTQYDAVLEGMGVVGCSSIPPKQHRSLGCFGCGETDTGRTNAGGMVLHAG
ncbi:hypothetical protein BVC80_1417g15 [Macleaya cordata]|uniref:Zinc finger protein n=1 Tax=Macleaya cordata TaxID=56857 RepID=A0A200Q5K2_MACCD|nr:hypothetical protein BVC80_1417g15 [Macleaya cordata]